jgi:hypothetical protein
MKHIAESNNDNDLLVTHIYNNVREGVAGVEDCAQD